MIDLNDKRKTFRKNGIKYDIKYRCYCDKCGKDRSYRSKGRADQLCKICAGKISHNNMTSSTKLKMSLAKKGKSPWNKGKTGTISEISRQKLSNSLMGKRAWNKGIKQEESVKIKISAKLQDIDITAFNGFKKTGNLKERMIFKDKLLSEKCFERDDYACDICKVKGIALQAHHLNSFAHFTEQRFEVDNLITLCTKCHKKFHIMFGNGRGAANTEQQYKDFKNLSHKKQLIILTGVSGSGKSHLTSKLSNNHLEILEVDKIGLKGIIDSCRATSKIPLVIITVGVSTLCKKLAKDFNPQIMVLDESKEEIIKRLAIRGGIYTPTMENRLIRMKRFCEIADYHGNQEQILSLLQSF